MGEPRPQPDKITAPEVNFSNGLRTLEIPELGPKSSGKVRDWWKVPGTDLMVFVTTDRQSAFDVVVGTIPGKGKALNQTSAWWSKYTNDILPTDVVATPHPNVKVAHEAVETLPVEMVYRRYMAKSSTSTSIYRNYNEGRRNIYGIEFTDGLMTNQPFPEDLGRDGIIFTPTTKAAESEHDQELTEEQAREMISSKFGAKIADRAIEAGYRKFQRGEILLSEKGLVLADTKFEMGIDGSGNLMGVDEELTPDSSRIWFVKDLYARIAAGVDPEGLDKEILRRWLAGQGFTGKEGEQVPVIPEKVKRQMFEAYSTPYRMLSGKDLSSVSSHPQVIRVCIASYLASHYYFR